MSSRHAALHNRRGHSYLQGNLLENRELLHSLNEAKAKSTVIADSLAEGQKLQVGPPSHLLRSTEPCCSMHRSHQFLSGWNYSSTSCHSLCPSLPCSSPCAALEA